MEKLIWPLIAISGMGAVFAVLLTAAHFLLPPGRSGKDDGDSSRSSS